jgi:integrase
VKPNAAETFSPFWGAIRGAWRDRPWQITLEREGWTLPSPVAVRVRSARAQPWAAQSPGYTRENPRGHRDATMILIGYRHGLRASELCDLQWPQVELTTGRLHVRRAKNGSPSVHPMQGDEIRALRRLQREQGASSHVFMTRRDGPMTPKAFHALFGRNGERAKMPFPIHPHMLRHGCGYGPSQRWPRHQGAASMARPSQHPTHCALHGAGTG